MVFTRTLYSVRILNPLTEFSLNQIVAKVVPEKPIYAPEKSVFHPNITFNINCYSRIKLERGERL